MAVSGLVALGEPASAAVTMTWVRTIGGPGHAGLYGWGAGTMSDGSVLISDYWNLRVQRFSADGQLLGTVIPDDGNHEAPYDVAVDTRTDTIYVGDVDGSASVDKYSATGEYLGTLGVPGQFEYPAWVAVDAAGPGRRRRLAQEQDRGVQRPGRAALRVRLPGHRAERPEDPARHGLRARRPALRPGVQRRSGQHLPPRRDLGVVRGPVPRPDRRQPRPDRAPHDRRGDRRQHRRRESSAGTPRPARWSAPSAGPAPPPASSSRAGAASPSTARATCGSATCRTSAPSSSPPPAA